MMVSIAMKILIEIEKQSSGSPGKKGQQAYRTEKHRQLLYLNQRTTFNLHQFRLSFNIKILVRRHSSNSRGPTPTEENGLADSTNATGSPSRISVVTQGGGRYVDAPPSSRLRCRDFDGELNMEDKICCQDFLPRHKSYCATIKK